MYWGQMGYRECEIARMYFGKWCDLFTEYKKIHNIQMQRMIFEEKDYFHVGFITKDVVR